MVLRVEMVSTRRGEEGRHPPGDIHTGGVIGLHCAGRHGGWWIVITWLFGCGGDIERRGK